MCTTFFAYGVHRALVFLLAFNRDEFIQRGTYPLHYWEDAAGRILAGRDSQGNGTWLALSKDGKFACLTNYRKGPIARTGPRSRGALPVEFLSSDITPMNFLKGVQPSDYSPFSMLAADFNDGNPTVAYICSDEDAKPVEITPGIHGFSNGHIDHDWPKVTKGKVMLEKMLASMDSELSEQKLPWERIYSELLDDDRKVETMEDAQQTGFPPTWEYELSSINIPPFLAPEGIYGRTGPRVSYGTRSQTVVAVWKSGLVEVMEKSRDSKNIDMWTVRKESFIMKPEQGKGKKQEL